MVRLLPDQPDRFRRPCTIIYLHANGYYTYYIARWFNTLSLSSYIDLGVKNCMRLGMGSSRVCTIIWTCKCAKNTCVVMHLRYCYIYVHTYITKYGNFIIATVNLWASIRLTLIIGFNVHASIHSCFQVLFASTLQQYLARVSNH